MDLLSLHPQQLSTSQSTVAETRNATETLLKLATTSNGSFKIDKSFFDDMLNAKCTSSGGELHGDPAEIGSSNGAPGISVQLMNRELWEKFHRATNEMVVTKPGRKMFPKVELRVSGLDPKAYYCVAIAMRPTDNYRYKFQGGCWSPSGQDDMPECSNALFHHDGPRASGEYWMKNPVCFDKVKLTNRTNVDGGPQISLQSMHKYQPIITIIKINETLPAHASPVFTYVPTETQFIAVTAYQSERIIQLKVQHNPFAKGFREGSVRKRSLSISPDSDSSPTSSSSSGGVAAKRSKGNLQLPCPLPDSTQVSSPSFTSIRPSQFDPFSAAMASNRGALSSFVPYYCNALAYSGAFGPSAAPQLKPYGVTGGPVEKANDLTNGTEGSAPCIPNDYLQHVGKQITPATSNYGASTASQSGATADWQQAAGNAIAANPYSYWNLFQQYQQMFPAQQQPRNC